ncbi:MAG: glycosyltransferase, partial [Chloroflexota bacterium]
MSEDIIDLKKFQPRSEIFTPLRTTENVEVSVVIPLFNEQESLSELYDRLSRSMKSTGRNYEIIFVDDGSTDGTLEILNHIQNK